MGVDEFPPLLLRCREQIAVDFRGAQPNRERFFWNQKMIFFLLLLFIGANIVCWLQHPTAKSGENCSRGEKQRRIRSMRFMARALMQSRRQTRFEKIDGLARNRIAEKTLFVPLSLFLALVQIRRIMGEGRKPGSVLALSDSRHRGK